MTERERSIPQILPPAQCFGMKSDKRNKDKSFFSKKNKENHFSFFQKLKNLCFLLFYNNQSCKLFTQ